MSPPWPSTNCVENLTLWDELPQAWGKEAGKYVAQGAAKAAIIDNPQTAHSGRYALRIVTSGGPWSLRLMNAEGGANLASYDALSFWVRAEQNASGESLRATGGRPVAARSGRHGASARAGRRIRPGRPPEHGVPPGRYPRRAFLKEAGEFRPALQRAVIFSGDGQAAATYWIDTVELLRFDELKNESPR